MMRTQSSLPMCSLMIQALVGSTRSEVVCEEVAAAVEVAPASWISMDVKAGAVVSVYAPFQPEVDAPENVTTSPGSNQ